ncbi:MAG TPA: adenylate/guanylate cyclase domain-containing protein [Acidimicrobiia bacterium]|nr:adenylate/guanylate cyclase domain-containing protein [Acidimicrobiia bacterium]
MTDLPTGTVTFLFTDLEGSTRLWEEHPQPMPGAMARHDEILRDAVESHGGHVVKTTGDGFHAAFADASAAVTAAVAAERALACEPWDLPGPLRVRMGLHTCHADVRDGDYYGSAVNRAARLMSAAHGGQIVVSLATEELTRDTLTDEVELADLGEHRLRDLSRPERVFEVRAPGLDTGFPALQTLDAYPTNLPLQLSSFVGRETELAAIAEAMQQSRLVTVTGVGGVGKTRLAIQLAAEVLPSFPDGAWLCELAGVNEADAVTQLVATILGVRERAEVGLETSIADFLRRRTALLVLDNCEHVLDATARFATTVLQTCPHVQVLATSREGLAVEGERVWPLRSLPTPGVQQPLALIAASDAVRLFVERGEMARPGFTLDDASRAAVADICRRLDGIPLAIELAAARVSAMRPGDIAARVDERFRLLTGGRRTAVERHQTLRAAVDWSYALLSDDEQRVFARLGVFAGGFDATAAEAVVAGDGIEAWDVIDAVASLVDKSMVVDEEPIDDTTRYGMLETLRQYAIEQLAFGADVDGWRRRHAEHFAGVAASIGEGLVGPDEMLWRRRLRADVDNLRAAVTWSFERDDANDVEHGIAIVTALRSEAFNHSSTIGAWAEQAMHRLDATSTDRRATVLSAAASSAMTRGDHETAQRLVRTALAEGAGVSWRARADASVLLAYSQLLSGDHAAALATLNDAQLIARESGRTYDLVRVLNAESSYRGMVPGDPRARLAAEEAVELARRLRNPSMLANALYGLAWGLFTTDPNAARLAVEESYDLVQRIQSGTGLNGSIAAMTAHLRARSGDLAGARAALRTAFEHYADTGDRPQLIAGLNRCVHVLLRSGDPDTAAVLVGVMSDGPLEAMNNFPGSRFAEDDRRLVELEAQLGTERYRAARAEGAALGFDEVVMLALGALDDLGTEP